MLPSPNCVIRPQWVKTELNIAGHFNQTYTRTAHRIEPKLIESFIEPLRGQYNLSQVAMNWFYGCQPKSYCTSVISNYKELPVSLQFAPYKGRARKDGNYFCQMGIWYTTCIRCFKNYEISCSSLVQVTFHGCGHFRCLRALYST